MKKFALLRLENCNSQGHTKQKLSLVLQVCVNGVFLPEIIRLEINSLDRVIVAYQNWQLAFNKLFNEPKNARALTIDWGSPDTELESCRNLAHEVVAQLNAWLKSQDWSLIKNKLFDELTKSPAETVLILQAEEHEILKLPWHLGNFGAENHQEVVVSTLAYERLERPTPKNPRTKVRILVILGNSRGINLEKDRQILASLPNVELILLEQPQRKELYQRLWDEDGYDLLFFAGHSSRGVNGEKNVISFNSQEILAIDKLKEALRVAISLGLKLAIFNSCDGFGLGQQLADLQIPQVIVMRESVPDTVAQKFLKHLLEPFASGQSLYSSMQLARRYLQQDLESIFPGASWLPVIWQNPTETPLTWQELPGIRVEPTWRGCCRAMLVKAAIKRLGNNMLAAGEGLGYELEEIYVPLGLVERKKSERRRENVAPEKGSQLYEPEIEYKVTKVYQQPEFFEEVLRQGKSPNSQGRRLVLIGEPGAGKTTLLQKIGNWVLNSTTEAVPIWISLADLQGQSLASYLRQNWLEKAMSTIQVPERDEDALRQLFQSGRVWLLLDGVDELSTTSANPIVELVNQLTGWVTEARLVLTCRLNLWETAKDTLEDFDVYRNLDFSYGDINSPEDQVKQFLDRWFNYNRTIGSNLRAQLDERGRERIRDLVKNPLRLSLLCRTWQWGQGSLPRTKAELYREFTEAVYQWKQNIFPTTTTQQDQLNRALSRLAKKALEQPRSRFRLAPTLVTEELGEFDSPLFQRALQIGWINQVGVAAENPSEKVYAFFHPTFQEYFAARAIADWHDLFTYHNNFPAQGIYRVFEPQWREVILLWLGREDIPHQVKEEFFEALREFRDGCGSFYEWQSYLLIAAGIAEFWQYTQAEEFIAQTARWCCCGSIGIQDSHIIFSTIREEAKMAMRSTDRSRAIEALTNLLNQSQDLVVRFQAAQILTELAPVHLNAIQFLINLISEPQYIGTYLDVQAAETLSQIGIGNSNSEIIRQLNERLRNSQDERILLRLARCLGKIEPGNSEAIYALIYLMNNGQQPMTRNLAIGNLGEIADGNLDAINAVVELIRNALNNPSYNSVIQVFYAISSLGKIGSENSSAISVLTELLQSRFEELRLEAVNSLINLNTGISDVSVCLINLLNTSQNESIKIRAEQCLSQIDSDYNQTIASSINSLPNTDNPLILRTATDILEEANSDLSNIIESLTQRLRSSQDEDTLRATAESLGRLEPGNLEAVDVLISLLRNGRGALIPYDAVSSLKKIIQKNLFQVTVSKLRDFSGLLGRDNVRYGQCYDILWYCAKNLAYPDFYQAFFRQPLSPISTQTLIEQINAIAQQRRNTSKTYPMLTNPERFATQQGIISQLQSLLRARNIALIFDGGEPNPELVEFYQELIKKMPSLYIGWITFTVLPPPLKTFSPREPNRGMATIREFYCHISPKALL